MIFFFRVWVRLRGVLTFVVGFDLGEGDDSFICFMNLGFMLKFRMDGIIISYLFIM